MLVFAKIDHHLPTKNYYEFDFNRFYEDKFNNLEADELKLRIKEE